MMRAEPVSCPSACFNDRNGRPNSCQQWIGTCRLRSLQTAVVTTAVLVSSMRCRTRGHCYAVAGYQIHQGHFGDVRLDGLRAAAIWKFPAAVHLGNGIQQVIADERADSRQREALVKILSGEETEEMATVWWVFSAMSPTSATDVQGHRPRSRCGEKARTPDDWRRTHRREACSG